MRAHVCMRQMHVQVFQMALHCLAIPWRLEAPLPPPAWGLTSMEAPLTRACDHAGLPVAYAYCCCLYVEAVVDQNATRRVHDGDDRCGKMTTGRVIARARWHTYLAYYDSIKV